MERLTKSQLGNSTIKDFNKKKNELIEGSIKSELIEDSIKRKAKGYFSRLRARWQFQSELTSKIEVLPVSWLPKQFIKTAQIEVAIKDKIPERYRGKVTVDGKIPITITLSPYTRINNLLDRLHNKLMEFPNPPYTAEELILAVLDPATKLRLGFDKLRAEQLISSETTSVSSVDGSHSRTGSNPPKPS